MFKMRLTESPSCCCGEAIQNLNHIFWACPILESERSKLLSLLRTLNLFDSFSVEYILGNINKKIAAILTKFANIANTKLNISI